MKCIHPGLHRRRFWYRESSMHFFEEEGQLVIVDYKTDKVSDRSGQELVEKYREAALVL